MLQKCFLPLALLGAVAAGCGEDDNVEDGDGGARDGGTLADGSTAGDGGAVDAGLDGGGGSLQKGTYTTSNFVQISDQCGLELIGSPEIATLELDNTGTVLTLGRRFDATTTPSWTPANNALGTGTYTTPTTATLTVMTRVRIDVPPTGAGANDCEYDLQRTSNVVYVGVNSLTVDFTENESNFSQGCAAVLGLSAPCTSRYTFNLSK